MSALVLQVDHYIVFGRPIYSVAGDVCVVAGDVCVVACDVCVCCSW